MANEYQGNRPSRQTGNWNDSKNTSSVSLLTIENKEKIKKWITTEFNPETIEFAEKLGKELSEKELTTSQIRIFFGELRRIQMNGYEGIGKTDFLMLKPKVAYATKRSNNKGMDLFNDFFKVAHVCVNNEKEFENFVRLMEAVLAYHKFHGGK